MIKKIIDNLKNVRGLSNVYLLNMNLKNTILNLEDKNNIGTVECLKRKYTLVLTHDSSFREPAGDVVIQDNGKIVLPAVPFPEVKAENVVSSSPSEKIHNILVKRFNMNLKDEATLLIGFD